ncbi:hypothetical protein AAC387_Pa01g1833 [Persea americana]
MLALSPSSWFPTFGWPSDDNIGQDQNRWTEDYDHPFINYNREIDGLDSCFRISSPQLMGAIDGPKISPATSEDISPNLKKMSHNANERERRKKLNSLYSTLRSLLPVSDQKKLSIPATVSFVLKYIPELKKQVERLTQRKEEILSQISSQSDLTHLIKGRKDANGPLGSSSFPSISTTQVDEREVVVQICASDIQSIALSEIVSKLEEEGLEIQNASSFTAVGAKVFHNLHLQMEDSVKIECGLLSEKLMSFYRNKEELNVSYAGFC